jgi:DNA-binding transcriptional regulator/RsmH inhibitor MraZ
MKGHSACATTSESRAEKLKGSAGVEESHRHVFEQLLLPLEPVVATVESVKQDSKFSRVSIPQRYAAAMTAYAAYEKTRQVPPPDQASKKSSTDDIHSVRWIVCWHPGGCLCVTAERFREALVSQAREAVRVNEGEQATSVDFIDKLCVEVEIDSKRRLRIPHILVLKAGINENVIFSRHALGIEVWPKERFYRMLSIPSCPGQSQQCP